MLRYYCCCCSTHANHNCILYLFWLALPLLVAFNLFCLCLCFVLFSVYSAAYIAKRRCIALIDVYFSILMPVLHIPETRTLFNYAQRIFYLFIFILWVYNFHIFLIFHGKISWFLAQANVKCLIMLYSKCACVIDRHCCCNITAQTILSPTVSSQ